MPLWIITVGGTRFLYRILRLYITRFGIKKNSVKILIVGAGSAGVMILKELRDHLALNAAPVAFIDDDPKKRGQLP